jgi:hypothetical protein
MTPLLPIGWNLRSDGRFFYIVQGERLRAMFDVFAPREHTTQGIMQALRMAAKAEPEPPAIASEEEQRMRLGCAIIYLLHGMANNVVLAALTDVVSSTLAGTSPEFAEQMNNMHVFVQQMLFHFSRKVGVEYHEVQLPQRPPQPPGKTH